MKWSSPHIVEVEAKDRLKPCLLKELSVTMGSTMRNNHSLFIIVMSYISLFALGLTDNLRGALFPAVLENYSLNNTQGAFFFIVTSIFSILAGTTTHALSQKVSLFHVWRAGVLFMALGTIILFVAPTFGILLLGCTSLGIGFGILGVTQNVLIARVSPSHLTKKLLSGLHSMYGFASCLSPLLVASFSTYHLPWKSLFAIAGLVTLVLFCSSFYINSPMLPNPTPPKVIPFSDNPLSANKSSFSMAQITFVIFLSSYVAMELLLSTRATSYLTIEKHQSLAEASLSLTYFFMALLAGRLLFSFFSPPIGTKKTLLLSLLVSMLTVMLGLHYHPMFLSLSGFFMAPFYPLAMALLTELFPEKVSSMVSLTIGFQSLFVISMNLVLGKLSDLYGIGFAMHTAIAFGGLSWILLMNLDTSIPKALASPLSANDTMVTD